ncbi:MAG TPA: hypothetical protein VGJ84_00720 [Polyangiaceae bacterium]
MKTSISVCVCAALAGSACTTGEGTGWVKSDKLTIQDCWNGQFDLKPTFFGANPYREELLIRVQRGDSIEELSDGLTVLVRDVKQIRGSSGSASQLGSDVPIGLPPGVTPPGTAPAGGPIPQVGLSLYLHDTCHAQNGTVYSVGGSINFSSLFSGDIAEPNADDRLTEANFSADFTDPRDSSGATSQVTGYFRFYFQRGQPAQPFP